MLFAAIKYRKNEDRKGFRGFNAVSAAQGLGTATRLDIPTLSCLPGVILVRGYSDRYNLFNELYFCYYTCS